MKPRLNAPCQPHTGGDNPQPTDSAAANAAGPLGGSQPREHWREATIVEVARRRAATQPEQVAFTFLVDGEHQEERWAFAELDRRAKAIAAELRSRLTGKPDSRCIDGPEAPPRALIMLEPGAGYITTLFGCLYAGVVPVPVYPPDPFRIAQTLPRLQAIVGSAACDLAISSEGVLGGADSVLRRLCPGGAVAVEQVADAGADSFQPTHTGPGGLALLQYTSGTTGEPRGVPVTHANLIDNLRGMERLLDVDDALAVQWLPPYHDLGLIGGVFLPLYAGRPVVLMSPLDFMRRPARWLQAISRCRATTSAGPNFAYEHCLRKISDADCEGLDLSSWRVAASGAEPVRAATIERFCERFGRYGFRREAFVPAYGMAETTLMVSISPVGTPPTVVEVDPRALAESRVEPLPGGRPIVGCGPAGPGVEVRVVDPNTGQQTTGVGEIWVRGASVAAGYWRRPELTAERFDQTLRGAMGDEQRGFFRTGDLGFLRGGELFLVGRRKELIILAGRNFYPHDIEQAVQAAHPAFKAGGGAAVAVDQANEERLAVFQEVQRPRKQDLGELLSVARRVALEETGQEPLRVVLLPVGELPKTSSGKTRRGDCLALHQTAALTTLAEWPAAGGNAKNPAGTPAQTEPGQTQPTQTQPTQSEPPQTETEQWLAALWADALGTAEVGRGDSFFALGGRSLQVTQMLSGVAERTGLILPLATLIDEPTLGGLAAHIDKQASNGNASAISRPAAIGAAGLTIDPAAPQPLSPSQHRFWMVEQLGVPGGANVPLALRLDAKPDAELLEAALNRLVERHAVLRYAVHGDSAGATQTVVTPARVRLEPWAPQANKTLEDVLSNPAVWKPFALDAPPLLRAALVETAAGPVLLLVVHHMVCDGVSLQLLLEELAAICDGKALPEAPPAQLPPTSVGQGDAEYWRGRLAGLPPTLELPLESPPAADTGDHASAACLDLPRSVCEQADRLAAAQGVTPFLVYLSAMQLTLARYTGQSTIAVGTAVANRSGVAPAAVGCFVNTAPLVAEIDEDATYADWLRDAHRRLLEDLDHAAAPWEEIVQAAGKPRVPGRMPVAQAFFVHDDRRSPAGTLAGARIVDAATDYRGLGIFDVSLVVESGRPAPCVKLIYNADRLPPKLAAGLLDSYRSLLQAAVEDPTQTIAALPIFSAAERDDLARGGEPPAAKGPAWGAATRAIRDQAASTPQADAVVCGGETASYAELRRRAGRIAGGLRAAGVTRGDRVGLMLHRSIDLPAAILGVWQAGAAYVPLDPEHPQERLSLIAADAGLRCVVADGQAAEKMAEDTAAAPAAATPTVLLAGLAASAEDPAAAGYEPEPDQPAYVMYTSGSTGTPKGVVVTHGSVANLLRSFSSDTPMAPGDTMLGATTFAFDISVLELMLPLASGATLLLPTSGQAADARALGRLLAGPGVTHLQGTPSWYRMLLSAGWRPSPTQTLLCGGEEVPPDVAGALLETAGQFWNVYGPTETTIWSTRHRIAAVEGPLPIGRPIAGTRCYILDKRGRLAPRGVWGELAIAGAGVADGYWNRPELTAERFVPDPFAPAGGERPDGQPARMYRTGDTARWNAHGLLEFGGRSDGQVKVRGHRVELREVELALGTHDAVGEVAVVVSNPGGADAALVAYVTPANGHACEPPQLLAHLAQRLPGYMAPSAVIQLPELPKTENGKIDRNRLPRRGIAGQGSAPKLAPRTPLEQQLSAWVCELLRIDHAGPFDNFFELGGQSLLATQLVVRMRDELGVEPPLRAVYEDPTIAAWAELILEAQITTTADLPGDLLRQIGEMTDAQAAEFLQSLGKRPSGER